MALEGVKHRKSKVAKRLASDRRGQTKAVTKAVTLKVTISRSRDGDRVGFRGHACVRKASFTPRKGGDASCSYGSVRSTPSKAVASAVRGLAVRLERR